MKKSILLWMALITLAAPAGARAEELRDPVEVNVRALFWHEAFDIKADGTYVQSIEWASKIITDKNIAAMKQSNISFSTSVQKLEIKEVYTIKPDGKKIVASEENYQVQTNTGRGGANPAYSDYTTMTVIFPDVAVGDTVGLTYRIVTKEAIFPNMFSATHRYSHEYPVDDVKVRFEWPESMPLRIDFQEMEKTIDKTAEGRRVMELAFHNPDPWKPHKKKISNYVPEKYPGYTASTFASYRQIAEAYGVRATPKGAVTPRIKELADSIVSKATPAPKGDREVAGALYEWVATNISYAGNCIGIGAVVPRDVDFVLDNKIGDCKDHATLLQSLLAAKKIKSVQALVNAGNEYSLPKVPEVSSVNHVINYLPSLDLYADSTSDHTPFGQLPPGDVDKPVLFVDGFREGARTPVLPVGTNRQTMVTHVQVNADGSVTGNVKVAIAGPYASDMSTAFRNIPKESVGEVVKGFLRGQGYAGDGKLNWAEAPRFARNFEYDTEFTAKNVYIFPGPRAFEVRPMFFSVMSMAAVAAAAQDDSEFDGETTCDSGRTEETYEYVFPDTVKIVAIPDNVKIEGDHAVYTATYKQEGNTLRVVRTLDDRTPFRRCSAEYATAYRKFSEKILPDVKAQVIYK